MTVKFDIKKATEIIGGEVDKVVRGAVLDVFSKIVKRTPVGNPDIWKNPDAKPAGYSGGRLRANWQVSMGAPATGEVGQADKSGSSTIDKAVGKIEKYSINHTMYFTNNLPYAEVIEFGHHSRQAPSGMVRVTIEEFDRMLDQRARQHG